MNNITYNNILSDVNIYSLASSDISAFEYMVSSGNFKAAIDKFLLTKKLQDYQDSLDIICDKQHVEKAIDKFSVSKTFNEINDSMSKMRFLILGEDEATVNFIDAIAVSLSKKVVGKNCRDQKFYEYFLEDFNMQATKTFNKILFSTMDDELKKDMHLAKEIVLRSNNLIKKHSFMYLYEHHPNLVSYPDALVCFDDSVKKDKDFIHFALNHDEMSLYAESLCSNEKEYADVITNYKSSITYNINEYATRRLTNPETVKSKMFKA
jgi:hypothetical protein